MSPDSMTVPEPVTLDDIEAVLGGRADGSASAATRPSAY